MKIILVYDINERRVQKVLKICRKYLHWVQNSVFEGELTEAQLERLKSELNLIINEEEDSIILYTFKTTWYTNREIIGVDKGNMGFIL
jgi:CRISPR-associated protein Cas2